MIKGILLMWVAIQTTVVLLPVSTDFSSVERMEKEKRQHIFFPHLVKQFHGRQDLGREPRAVLGTLGLEWVLKQVWSLEEGFFKGHSWLLPCMKSHCVVTRRRSM